MRILFVCTGNVCRSPAAVLLAGALGADEPGLHVESAGTFPLTGQGVHPATAAALARRGLDAGGHRARPIGEGLVAAADLVLTMTREQRAETVAIHPKALRRTFTLRELRRLVERAEDDSPRGAAAWVASVGRWRGLAEPGPDDVPDPYGRPEPVHEQVVALLEQELLVSLPPLLRAVRAVSSR